MARRAGESEESYATRHGKQEHKMREIERSYRLLRDFEAQDKKSKPEESLEDQARSKKLVPTTNYHLKELGYVEKINIYGPFNPPSNVKALLNLEQTLENTEKNRVRCHAEPEVIKRSIPTASRQKTTIAAPASILKTRDISSYDDFRLRQSARSKKISFDYSGIAQERERPIKERLRSRKSKDTAPIAQIFWTCIGMLLLSVIWYDWGHDFQISYNFRYKVNFIYVLCHIVSLIC